MDFKVFMLKAYQRHLKQEQWPTLSPKPANWNKDTGWRNGATPLLISECARLNIKWDPEKEIFCAHPCNMPKVSIQVIEIVGTILRCDESLLYLKLDVWDGSGTVEVNFDLKRAQEEIENDAKLGKEFATMPEISATALRLTEEVICHNDDTQNSAQQGFQDQYGAERKSTYKDMYGKTLEVGDYVNIFGFCALKYNDPDDVTPWDLGVLPKMIFVGLHIDAIDEETYERKLSSLIHEGIYKETIAPPINKYGNYDNVYHDKW